jgi:tRNA synthetase class I (I, L, M and V)
MEALFSRVVLPWHVGICCGPRRASRTQHIFNRNQLFVSSLARGLSLNARKLALREPMAAAYDPGAVEQGWYEAWEGAGLFSAGVHAPPSGRTFSVLLPPPNVTGSLHIGHALTVSIQDALVRWRRMCGDDVVFIPGTMQCTINITPAQMPTVR